MIADTEIPTPARPRRAAVPLVTLTLRDTGEGPPFDVRLARLLKLALRVFGMRCIDIQQQPAESRQESNHDRT